MRNSHDVKEEGKERNNKIINGSDPGTERNNAERAQECERQRERERQRALWKRRKRTNNDK